MAVLAAVVPPEVAAALFGFNDCDFGSADAANAANVGGAPFVAGTVAAGFAVEAGTDDLGVDNFIKEGFVVKIAVTVEGCKGFDFPLKGFDVGKATFTAPAIGGGGFGAVETC